MSVLLAWLVAVVAVAAQPTAPPDRFTDGMLQRGAAVVSVPFVGITWDCGGRSDETCFAGLRAGLLVTGP